MTTDKKKKPASLQLTGLKDADSVESKRFDITSLVRYKGVFAFKFVQLDYHFTVEQLQNAEKNDPTGGNQTSLGHGEWKTIARLITDYDGLIQLKTEIETLLQKMEEQSGGKG